MSTVKLVGGIYAQQYSWSVDSDPQYFFLSHYNEKSMQEYQAQEYVYICPFEIEVEELSPGEFTARRVQSLQMKKDALREVFLDQSKHVDEKIQNLLAIGHDDCLPVRPAPVPDDLPF
jgi:hypothetical protein